MKKIYALLITCFCIQQISIAQETNSVTQTKNANPHKGFVENKGQIADHQGNSLSNVLFQSSGTGPQIFVTTSGLTYVFHQYNSVAPAENEKHNPLSWSKLEMNLEGATIKKENVVMENALEGYSNFYYAHCPQGILEVKSYHKVTIKNIYPGIDWVLNADDANGLSHDFVVHPGADPDQIKISYKGENENISLAKNGLLTISSPYGKIVEGGLNVFELNSRKNIAAKFSVNKNNLSFSLGDYNITDLLVIDPPLQWTMPQASTNFDYGYAVSAAHDGSGDVLLTGESDGTDFPVLNAYQGFENGFEDMVVVRLNSAGTRLWSTYYGGSNFEQGKGIASDNAGNCYVTGTTGSSDFPVLNSLQANFGGGTYDAMIVKFNSTGVRQWASWRGGTMNDYGNAITCDGAGNSYVTGYTNSSTFPTHLAIQSSKGVGNDAFIMKLDASQVLQWSTFFGGDDEDKGRAICLDATGANVYVTGSALSGTFPVTLGVFQSANANAYNYEDAFIVKMSSSQAVQFCTFCGGTDADFGQGIAVDNGGNVFVAGYTLSADFPITNPFGGAYVDSTLGALGAHDAFVMECNSTGTTRKWSTYLGGTAPDMGFAIAFDLNVGIYVCGNTASTDFPLHQPIDNNYYQSVQGDGGNFNDKFIAWFDVNDSMRWSTYYGDATDNEAYGICNDANNNIFVVGVDNNDIGVLKFSPGVPTAVADANILGEDFIYPNPASETVNFKFSAEKNDAVKIEIVDMLGEYVAKEEYNVVKGENLLPIDISGLAKGTYFLKISSNGNEAVKKFVKE